MTQEELEIAQAACCVGTIWDQYEGTEKFNEMVGKRVQHLIELVRNYQPSLPSDLDEAANEEADRLFADMKIDGDMIYLPTAKVLMIAFARFGVEWMAKQGETREVDLAEIELNKFTEKVKTFQGRYKYPEILSIKGAMAFMARMFYQYPSVARQWYERLPKSIMD